MYVLYQDRMTVTIFDILLSLRPHLLLPSIKPSGVFIDEVDQNIDDDNIKIDYRYESARLKSFKNWPAAHVKPEKLAAAGFYFTGQGDIVKCFDCHAELCQWLEGDDPMMDHERLSPTCRFVENNVPEENFDYRYESARLKSFKNWPATYIKPEKLAAAGFYFIGQGNIVRCFDCQAELCQLLESDDAMMDHERFSPTCKFVRNNIPEEKLDYRYESARLKSFKNWPVTYIEPEDLAAAGFYFTGQYDIVKCFNCPMELYQWVEGDDPMADHKRFSPTCKFMENNRFSRCENVAALHDNSVPSSSSTDQDVCCMYDMPANFRSITRPLYPEYCSYNARLSSFNKYWDSQHREQSQTKEELAKAGFYYVQSPDCTACFYCGCAIRNWNPEDNPWELHCSWMNDDCKYLLSIKGQDYEFEVREIMTQRWIDSLDTLPSRRPLAAIEARNALAPLRFPSIPPRRHHQNWLTDMENISDNIAALSIDRSNPFEKPEESAACASNITDLRSTSPTIDEHMLCKICYKDTRNILFMFCNHIVACPSCSQKLDLCPVCREEITHKIRVYYA